MKMMTREQLKNNLVPINMKFNEIMSKYKDSESDELYYLLLSIIGDTKELVSEIECCGLDHPVI